MILVINICKDPLHYFEFVKPVEDILLANGIKFVTKHYKEVPAPDIKWAKKVIICGTSLADNDFIDNMKEFDWLKSFNKPILGICGGAHIIGLLLGYKIKKSEEIGLKDINLEKDFLGTVGVKQVYHLHQLQVLPEVFHEKNFYATLFHPEVRNKQMVVNFAKI